MSIRSFARKLRTAVWNGTANKQDWPSIEHGERGINDVGHRAYVGGMWDEIGRLQFDFLVEQGLRPHHYLCDVACGSLRAGTHFIRYLEAGHYLGIDKEPALIEAGLKKELGDELRIAKQPEFVVSSEFDFDRFSHPADFALAQSLFTHLPPQYIDDCFRKLRSSIQPGGVFFATFFEGTAPSTNPGQPHDHRGFVYTQSEMTAFGARHSWIPHYIGNWNHPRGQVMVRYTAP